MTKLISFLCITGCGHRYAFRNCYNMLSSVLLLLTMIVSGYAAGLETLSQSVITAFLSGHNDVRSSLGLPDLVWNSTLVSVAERHLAYCYFKDFMDGGNQYVSVWRDESKYGTTTTIAPTYPAASHLITTTKPDNVAKANNAIGSWWSEAINVDPAWACISDWSCRSYSQLVWRSTTSVGCAIFTCSEMQALVKCEYYPQGNVKGEIPY
ncbi:unnamed protein product [Lymnaea stagnalis]|uniref:SCP domain-containing protein n=1 Tax=Lymnaea stagnalis TaxID=6523 RepID=A0AAV2HUH5_LYMST